MSIDAVGNTEYVDGLDNTVTIDKGNTVSIDGVGNTV